jgi:hypothetical protein
VKLSSLKNNPSNPRHISEESFARLCASIDRDPEFLALRPIVVDADGVVLGGNMRLRALRHLGYDDVPDEWVRRVDTLDPDAVRRFVLVDNAPEGMAGDWDWDVLANEWDDMDLAGLGFEVPELPDGDEQGDDDDKGDEGGDTKTKCPKCGHEF